VCVALGACSTPKHRGGRDGFKPALSSMQYRARGRISFRDVGKTCEVSWI
jgi:hypothetical protein